MIYNIARVKHHDAELIFVPVSPDMAARTKSEQQQFVRVLTGLLEKEGLNGNVVPVWRTYTGKARFVAPVELQECVSDIDWSYITRHINSQICYVDQELALTK